MSLIISTRESGMIAIVHIQGPLTLGPPLRALKARIERLFSEKAHPALILNLEAVSEVDSAGLGELVAIHSLAARNHCRIALVQASPRLKELLSVTHLDGFFTFHDDERSAAASL
jgi:anti-anti-sigma factor